MPKATDDENGVLTGVRGREIAERRLREAISRGDAAPGHRLVEADLCEMYGVSRNSVRLALDALVAEGLLERVPNRGARVRTVSPEEAIAILECRMVLDGLIAGKAAEAATAEQIDRLLANREQMREAVAEHDLLKYSDLIQQHHGIVRDIARHPIAAQLTERLQAQLVRHQFQLSLRPARARQSLDELDQVVDAIASRDPERAEETARAHFRGLIASVVEESRVA